MDGSFYVTGARPRLLTLGARVAVGAGESAEIVRRAGTEERPIVRLAGIDDRDAAEALRGQTLTVAEADLPRLGDGEYWAHELEGCRIVDGARQVGVVRRLVELPSCEALEVSVGESGSELVLVPMVKDAIREVAVERGRIEVDLEFLDLPGEKGARA